jgi:hypothetical protein
MHLKCLTGCGLIALLIASVTRADVTTAKLTATFLRKGNTIQIVWDGDTYPMEVNEHLVLKTVMGEKNIRELSDLEGYVTINSESTALQYVRLRTGPTIWQVWPGEPLLEIVERGQIGSLPNYGLTKGVRSNASSGYMGILSTSAFSTGQFKSANVKHTNANYIISRWLFTQQGQAKSVQLVQETVGAKGSYNRRVIINRPVPRLPNTQWYMPKFE